MLRSLPDEDAKKLLKASKVNTYARRESLVSRKRINDLHGSSPETSTSS